MEIRIEQAAYQDVSALRELYRHEANCQIIHDSSMSRSFTQPYLIAVNGRLAGYGAVFHKHYPGRAMEFYTFPEFRPHASAMLRELISVGRATEIEAQSNMPLALSMLLEFGKNVRVESILFHDGLTTSLEAPGAVFRARDSQDRISNVGEPEGDYVVAVDGKIASNGGYLCHYNPPYGDIYMETSEEFRRMGYGSYFVQELKRVCYEAGKKPSARCNPDNLASRRTLERAGFRCVGHLVAADV